MPLPIVRSVGSYASAASGNVTPGLPAGWQPDDILICITEQRDNVPAVMPLGWTQLYAANSGTIHRASIFWKRAAPGETNPLITRAAGNAISARIISVSGCVKIGSPFHASSFTVTTPASATIRAAGVTTTLADCLLLFTVHNADNATAFTTPSGWSLVLSSNTALGSDCAIACFSRPFDTPGSTGDVTSSASGAANAISHGGLLALRPEFNLPTVDPSVLIEEKGALSGTPYVQYQRTFKGQTDRWITRGTCNQCGLCVIGAANAGDYAWDGPVGTPDAVRDLRVAGGRPDEPVAPGFIEDMQRMAQQTATATVAGCSLTIEPV